MIFKAKTEDMIDMLQTVGYAVSSRAAIQMLSHLMIECDKTNQILKFTSTDLTIYITAVAPANIEEDMSFTVPARRFIDIIRNFPNREIEINKKDENEIEIKAKRSIYRMKVLTIEDYPPKPVLKKKASFTLPQETLRDMIKKVIPAVSHDEAKIYLNGIHICLQGNDLRLVSTDGHRLNFKKHTLEGNFKKKTELTVPTKAVSELLRILGGEGEVEVQVSDTLVCFSLKDIKIYSRLIEERFPNYEQLLQKETDKVFKIPAEELEKAANRLDIIVDDQFKSVRMLFKKNSLVMTGGTPDIGSGEEVITIKNNEEEDVEIALNIKFILDVLKNIDTEHAILEIKNALSPGIFKAEDDDTFISIIMPMRM